MLKRIAISATSAVALTFSVSACSSDADVVSENLSKAADNFEVERRIVFYNGITGEYILEAQGLCSVGNGDTEKRLSITCKTGDEEYKKHYLGLSDNVTWFAEQVEGVSASPYYYRVTFKPQTIIPDVDARGDGSLPEAE